MTKHHSGTVHFRWRPTVQALVQSLMIVETEVGFQAHFQVWDSNIIHEVDVLVLHGAPQAFNEYVVQGSATAIHADLDVCTLPEINELERGELCSASVSITTRRLCRDMGKSIDSSCAVSSVASSPTAGPPLPHKMRTSVRVLLDSFEDFLHVHELPWPFAFLQRWDDLPAMIES